MKAVVLICLTLCTVILGASQDEYEELGDDDNAVDNESAVKNAPNVDCWMKLNAGMLFQNMDRIDNHYLDIRNEVQKAIMAGDFDKSMVETRQYINLPSYPKLSNFERMSTSCNQKFVHSRGVALRELQAHDHRAWKIPSGLNLGGYCMLRMTDSFLFFHRMKLRNNTYFRINSLHNDLANMVVYINLALNDLHLEGAYERSLTDRDASVLIYAPTFGEVAFLLKDVRYKMQGRYRIIKNHLMIELVDSEIIVDDILMEYISQAMQSSTVKLERANLGDFMDRLKTDLDRWLKDYFNDYMIYTAIERIPHMDELLLYDKEKQTFLEKFLEQSIDTITSRIRLFNADTIRVPSFTLKSLHGSQIRLHNGVLRGLDSMYRRTVATGVRLGNVREIDAIVGFSNLKVVYKYEATLPAGVPPVAGVLTLKADDLAAHLSISIVDKPETVDLDIRFVDQMKPESLTLEGSANRMIANFKHLLEHQIVAMMTNTLMHGVQVLRNLPRCEPFIPGQVPDKDKNQLYAMKSGQSDLSETEEYKSKEVDEAARLLSTKMFSNKSARQTNFTKKPIKAKKFKLRQKIKKPHSKNSNNTTLKQNH